MLLCMYFLLWDNKALSKLLSNVVKLASDGDCKHLC